MRTIRARDGDGITEIVDGGRIVEQDHADRLVARQLAQLRHGRGRTNQRHRIVGGLTLIVRRQLHLCLLQDVAELS